MMLEPVKVVIVVMINTEIHPEKIKIHTHIRTTTQTLRAAVRNQFPDKDDIEVQHATPEPFHKTHKASTNAGLGLLNFSDVHLEVRES